LSDVAERPSARCEMAYSNGFLIEGSVFMDNVFATVTLSLIAGGVLFSLWKLGPRR